MKEILEILKLDGAITRENYAKIKKILTPDMLEQPILNNVMLIDYIMLKDFASECNRRNFVEYVFSLEEVSDNTKLNLYMKMLLFGVESCFTNPNRDHDSNFCSVAYLKVGKNFNKQIFKESRDLASIFSKFVPFLSAKCQKGLDAKRKAIAKKIMLNGLVSENYEQVIDASSNKRGIEDIVKYLMQSENYGTIIKLFEDNIFEINSDNFSLIMNTVICETIHKKKTVEARYNAKQTKHFLVCFRNVLTNKLNEQKNKTR